MDSDIILAESKERPSGRFTDVTDTLLPLFSDPDGRGGRRWEQVFGLAPAEQPKGDGPFFSVRVRRRSSSGS